jgi:hypothetical protein
MRRLLWPLCVLAAGCSQDLPVYSLVEGLRVLGIRAEPPTYLFDAPPAQVTVDALVVDPAGATVTATWTFCPVESDSACADFEAKVTAASSISGVNVADLRAAHLVGSPASADRATTGADLPQAAVGRPYLVPSFVVDAAPVAGLEDYFLYDGFFGYGQGAWPSAVLTVTTPTDQVTAQKRIVATVADLSAYNDVVDQQFHYHFCTAGQTAADGCVAWNPAWAGNHNPVFAATRWHPGKSPLDAFGDLPSSGVIEVEAGSDVRIQPNFTADSEESYQVIKTNFTTGTIRTTDLTEQISVSWFTTAGKLQDSLTWPLFTKTLDTVYTAPETPPGTDGFVTIWMVAQDQRGGESWTHVDLKVTPKTTP